MLGAPKASVRMTKPTNKSREEGRIRRIFYYFSIEGSSFSTLSGMDEDYVVFPFSFITNISHSFIYKKIIHLNVPSHSNFFLNYVHVIVKIKTPSNKWAKTRLVLCVQFFFDEVYLNSSWRDQKCNF